MFDVGDDRVVLYGQKPDRGGLLQCRVFAPDTIDLGDIRLDVSGLFPIARFQFVFFGIKILLTARYRLML